MSRERFQVSTFPVGPYQCNCSLIWDPVSKEAILIDPGEEAPKIQKKIEAAGCRVKAIIHTHAHFDHIGAADKMKDLTNSPLFLHRGDQMLWDNLKMQGSYFGFELPTLSPWDQDLVDGLQIGFGSYQLEVLHTPGHTPGSCCFRVDDLCFSGDTLFRQSIGRTDLWGGDFEVIKKSIKDRLYALDGDTRVICGHGPDTIIGEEKRSNPFVNL